MSRVPLLKSRSCRATGRPHVYVSQVRALRITAMPARWWCSPHRRSNRSCSHVAGTTVVGTERLVGALPSVGKQICVRIGHALSVRSTMKIDVGLDSAVAIGIPTKNFASSKHANVSCVSLTKDNIRCRLFCNLVCGSHTCIIAQQQVTATQRVMHCVMLTLPVLWASLSNFQAGLASRFLRVCADGLCGVPWRRTWILHGYSVSLRTPN